MILGSLSFEEVQGVITPLATPVVEGVENPALTPAALLLAGQAPPDQLRYRGWFAASIKATLYALRGTVIDATDETGATVSVLLVSARLAEPPAVDGVTLGVFAEVEAEVRAWA
jgi:hypothetical protein